MFDWLRHMSIVLAPSRRGRSPTFDHARSTYRAPKSLVTLLDSGLMCDIWVWFYYLGGSSEGWRPWFGMNIFLSKHTCEAWGCVLSLIGSVSRSVHSARQSFLWWLLKAGYCSVWSVSSAGVCSLWGSGVSEFPCPLGNTNTPFNVSFSSKPDLSSHLFPSVWLR